jgi:hypothetical protein
MVRFSEEVLGSVNRFVSANDHKANAPACHSQYKLIEAIWMVTLQTKSGGHIDRRFESFCRLHSVENFPRRHPEHAKRG